jgi:F-type H+-transporting ATPase subunit gamma
MSACCCCCLAVQASLIAEEILRQQGDAVRVIFNKFYSAISFRPTLATVLNADVSI